MAKKRNSTHRGYHHRHRSLVTQLASRALELLDTDVSRQVCSDLSAGRYEQLLGREIDPGSYRTAAEFRRDYLAVSLLSKFPFQEYRDQASRAKVALLKFSSSEESCKWTDQRLRKTETVLPSGVTAAAYLHTMQRKISAILGRFSWDSAEEFFGFGPGATTRLARRKADAYYKFGGFPDVTSRCADLALTAVVRVPGWDHSLRREVHGPVHYDCFNYVVGNRITTVPKNAKTERVIAIEPDLNMYLQKGIGGLMRHRLKERAGLDLNSQVLNQVLAKLGSETGHLATIDLASASDTVSWRLVQELLPPDWLEAVEHCRSPWGRFPDGTKVLYRKVSSMGNGFTFELESLLFLSAVLAVQELHPSSRYPGSPHGVYGDDIIIPVDQSQYLLDLLGFIGFEANMSKTFVSGPFRESCGKHYWRGEDVTPFYIREDIDNVARTVWFHNQMVRWLIREAGAAPVYLHGGWADFIRELRGLIPERFRKYSIPYGKEGTPEDFGDIGLLSPFDVSQPERVWFGSYKIRGLTAGFKRLRPEDDAFLLRQLYHGRNRRGASGEEWGSGISQSQMRVKVVRPITFQWQDPYVLID